MKFGSLFSGIGGLDLGLERAGLECAWQVEIDPFCRRVLEKHWPNVRRFDDVTRFCRRVYDCEPENDDGEVICPRCETEFGDCDCIGTDQLIDECGAVELIVGGFPCQPVSNAGHRRIDRDDRWLWPEFFRVVCELRPDYVLVENVGALSFRGLQRILGDLCALGFDAEWATLPAAAFGAVHRRDRVFLIGYTAGDGLERRHQTTRPREVATPALDNVRDWPALSTPLGIRSADGFSDYVDRIRSLGNAVVPQVAEWIGRQILAAVA